MIGVYGGLDITHVLSDILWKYVYVVLYMCVIELLFGFSTGYNLLYPNICPLSLGCCCLQ